MRSVSPNTSHPVTGDAAPPPLDTQSMQVWLKGRTWVVIVVAAVLLALVDSAQTSLIYIALDRPPSFTRVMLRYSTFWLTFVAWIPPVLFLANRYRLASPLSFRRVLIHIVGGSTFAVAQIATATFLDPTRPHTEGAYRELFLQWVRSYFGLDFLAYWAVVGGFYTIHYYRESRQRELAAAQLQASLVEARLQALRSQLNPHFLFNTLNAISVLVRKGEQEVVAKMLAQLSNLLRISLDDTCPQEIPLARELEFLDEYLEIQRIRFADRLTIRRQVAPDTLHALVPSMILQPLVENAVVHGVSARRGAGGITIETSRVDGTLCLRVSDSGPGFHAHDSSARPRGIGLANTKARLEQLYGPQHRIERGDSQDEGGMVTISIPFRTSLESGRPRGGR